MIKRCAGNHKCMAACSFLKINACNESNGKLTGNVSHDLILLSVCSKTDPMAKVLRLLLQLMERGRGV